MKTSISTPTDAELVAAFILRELQTRYPEQRRLMNLSSLADLPENFSLKGVAGDSRQGLLGWLNNVYPLILIQHLPTPEEMLEIQCRGQRYVSLLRANCLFPVGRHSDALAFLLHDLEHAHKFFGRPESHLGQHRFFNKIRQALHQGLFSDYMKDEQFKKEFHYLISDMNSHPVHLLKYLKAIVLNAQIRFDNNPQPDLSYYWGRLFNCFGMSQNETRAALKINIPSEENSDAQKTVMEFFISRSSAARSTALCS